MINVNRIVMTYVFNYNQLSDQNCESIDIDQSISDLLFRVYRYKPNTWYRYQLNSSCNAIATRANNLYYQCPFCRLRVGDLLCLNTQYDG